VFDDHPQGVAGAGRRLHRGAEARQRDAAHRAGAGGAGREGGVPKGVLNILTGNSSAIGKVLCEHPAVRFVGFTGSTEVGKILYQQAAVGVKKLGLELGGNAPFVVFDDADIDAAVDGAMVSKYRNMGQTCVCANRIYAQDKIYDQFVEKLSKKVAAMKIGDGTEQGVTQGPLINMAAVDKVEKHIADAIKHGAKIVTAASAIRSAAPSSSRRCWPTSRLMRWCRRKKPSGPWRRCSASRTRPT